MRMKGWIIAMMCLAGGVTKAVAGTAGDTLALSSVGNGLLPTYSLNPVDIHARRLSEDERRAYYRLVYNIRRTYPYAIMAQRRMETYNALRAEGMRKKDDRKFFKNEEKQIREDFLKDLKGLTKSQGAILLKLLARQTDTAAYFLLKDFRGSARAGAYQTLARLWGFDLKQGYDPQGADRDIETIVRMIESGRLAPLPIYNNTKPK
ncbi:MAG: DUF4294 domain-containing protein [Bacteroidales bacterium]|nr:DUF4294 domain-containing protein [Bacteroidales bacterium]